MALIPSSRLPVWLAAGPAALVAIACAGWSAGASAKPVESFLHPLGPVALEQGHHMARVIAVVMIVILPVLVGVPLIVWRYRAGAGKGEYRPEWEFSRKLEYVLWGLPVAVIAVLAVWLWQATARYDPYKPLGDDPLVVQAIGLDWKWLFIYPEQGLASVDELVVPTGRPIRLEMTTDTVMQSLLIAPLAGQVYAMPGMTTQLNFAASRTGVVQGENTQYNGTDFGRQKFTVRAVAPQDFTDWAAHVDRPLALSANTYRTLRDRAALPGTRQSLGLARSAEPFALSLAYPHLFQAVVAKYHTAGNPEEAAALGGTGAPPKADTEKKP